MASPPSALSAEPDPCPKEEAQKEQAAAENRLPRDAELAEARGRVGIHKLGFHPQTHTVWFKTEGMQVDLGGIAKGYAIDRAVAAAQRDGVLGGIVEVGGDLRCFGRIPKALIGKAADQPVRSLRRAKTRTVAEREASRDRFDFLPGIRHSAAVAPKDLQAWPLGLQSPFGEELLGKIIVPGGAVATSGHYRRYVTIDGELVASAPAAPGTEAKATFRVKRGVGRLAT